jgi:hypothetical protein
MNLILHVYRILHVYGIWDTFVHDSGLKHDNDIFIAIKKCIYIHVMINWAGEGM